MVVKLEKKLMGCDLNSQEGRKVQAAGEGLSSTLASYADTQVEGTVDSRAEWGRRTNGLLWTGLFWAQKC